MNTSATSVFFIITVMLGMLISPITFAVGTSQINQEANDIPNMIISFIQDVANKVFGENVANTGEAVAKIQVPLKQTPAGPKTAVPSQIPVQTTSLELPNSAYTYVYFGDKTLERIDSTNTEIYFHEDSLGSTRLTTDKNGVKQDEGSYEPFGNYISVKSSTNNKFDYTGKETDASGLYYYGARYYDPEIGRFTQIDPSYDPIQSPYAYVDNNPLNRVDPTGKEDKCFSCADATATSIRPPKQEGETFTDFVKRHARAVLGINPEDPPSVRAATAFKSLIMFHLFGMASEAFEGDAALSAGSAQKAQSASSTYVNIVRYEYLYGKRMTISTRTLLTAEELNGLLENDGATPMLISKSTGELSVLVGGEGSEIAPPSHYAAAQAVGNENDLLGFIVEKDGENRIIQVLLGGTSLEHYVSHPTISDAEQFSRLVRNEMFKAGLTFDKNYRMPVFAEEGGKLVLTENIIDSGSPWKNIK